MLHYQFNYINLLVNEMHYVLQNNIVINVTNFGSYSYYYLKYLFYLNLSGIVCILKIKFYILE